MKVREGDSDRSSWMALDKEYKNKISESYLREYTVCFAKDDLLDDLKFANQQIQDLKEEIMAMRSGSIVLSEQLSKLITSMYSYLISQYVYRY